MTADVDFSLITETMTWLRQFSQVDLQSNWYTFLDSSEHPLSVELATNPQTWKTWNLAQLNAKNHIPWSKSRQVLWLGQSIIVPTHLQGYPVQGLALRLRLTWWADFAQIYVNGVLVQEGDLFDCSTRILLDSEVTPGQVFHIALRLVSPNHDDGALVKSVCLYEAVEGLDPGFVADELTVLKKYLESFAPEALTVLEQDVKVIKTWQVEDREIFLRSLFSLRQQLREKVPHPDGKILLLGHAHLDLAWLWPVEDTWNAAQRTFSSVLNLQASFPELTFTHSTPALYHWIEQHRPDLFTQIQTQVKQGKWNIDAGFWVEPELNLISGESLVRQVLYGQRYCLEKFGAVSKIAWVPDSFGFCWQLPQILTQAGVECFVTQKLRWNDTTQFPYEFFWWEAPDGTRLFSYMSPLIGEGIDPVKMADYAFEFQRKTELNQALWLIGVGDHGGGPTRDMLETARRWEISTVFPTIEFTRTNLFLSSLNYQQSAEKKNSEIPVWRDELYLEFHRGCYTSHADQKRYNRYCEGLLYQAELWSALAQISVNHSYPQGEIESAWKRVLFNQFHDILPGSSIPEVYRDANLEWEQAVAQGQRILASALNAIATQISFPPAPHPQAKPFLVFNSLNWEQTQMISIPISDEFPSYQIYDCNQQQLSIQQQEDSLFFLAESIPAVGYRLFWLIPDSNPTPSTLPFISEPNFTLENAYLRVTLNSETGNISQIYDKIAQRELFADEANQLQFFQDSGQYWDAWNIDPNYAQHPLESPQVESITWLTQGQLKQTLRVIRTWRQSRLIQDYSLFIHSPILRIDNQVSWHESQVLLKVAFPLNLEADFVTAEIPCGAIERTTRSQTPQEKAKWEVYAINWIDLTDENSNYGISLLNNCKYGYDAQPSQLRLTLLRSPNWPDPNCDRGDHEFTYSIYPHSGNWKQAASVHRGYELNIPLQVVFLDSTQSGDLPYQSSLINLDSNSLILMAFKQAEDNSNLWILRCYESEGETTKLQLKSDLGLKVYQPVDLLESPQSETLEIAPWKITSLSLVKMDNQE